MKVKKISLPAIHDKDLEKILSDYDLIEDFKKLKLNCFNCNEVINNENLTGVIADNETLLFVCDNPDCLAHATSMNERNIE